MLKHFHLFPSFKLPLRPKKSPREAAEVIAKTLSRWNIRSALKFFRDLSSSYLGKEKVDNGGSVACVQPKPNKFGLAEVNSTSL